MYNSFKCFLIMIVVLIFGVSITFAERVVSVSIDGTDVVYTDEYGYPFIDQSGRTQVPFKITMEEFGCIVSWNSTTKSAIATMNGIKVEVPIGQNYIIKDGAKISMDTFAVIKNGRTYLPISAVLKAFGATVKWESNTTTVIVEKPFVERKDVAKLSFYQITKLANETRKNDIYDSPLPEISQYREAFSETVNYFTDREVAELLEVKEKKSVISYEDALSDIETYFKILKSSYGAYTYFGGDEKFNEAKKQAIQSLGNKSEVAFNDLSNSLIEALSFVRDDHFSINYKRPGITELTKYVHYYASSIQFDLDGKGYYQDYDNVRWYFDEENNNTKFISVEPTLNSDGSIVYSLVFFGPKTEINLRDSLVLSSENRNKTLNFEWVQSKNMTVDPVEVDTDKVYHFDNIPYIPFRRAHFGRDVINNYKAAGSRVANDNYIILDARGNTGSGDPNQYGWMGSYIGDNSYMYDYKQIYSYKTSKLSLKAFESFGNRLASDYSKLGLWNVVSDQGKWIENDNHIIVLLDSQIGSSGEAMIYMLRGMDNVTFIGSNTTGCTICGMVFDAYLPKSGLPIRMGMMLAMPENGQNIDAIGIEPDIWCDPSTSLEAVLKMIKLFQN